MKLVNIQTEGPVITLSRQGYCYDGRHQRGHSSGRHWVRALWRLASPNTVFGLSRISGGTWRVTKELFQ